jgi:hypothetical protein
MTNMTHQIMRARPSYRSPPARPQRISPRFTAGRGATMVRDVSVPGGPGHLGGTTVPGFSTSDAIASAASDGPTGDLLATSTACGGDTVVTFADGSTMTLVGIADISKVSFSR